MYDNTLIIEAFTKGFDGWLGLDPIIRAMIMEDFYGADCSASEYITRIGTGNIESYAKALIAGFNKWGVRADQNATLKGGRAH